MKIKVFSHMNDMGAGIDITKEQIGKIINSGLIDHAEFFFVTNYEQDNYIWFKDYLKEYSNINFLDLKSVPEEWEMPTLEYLKNYCDNLSEECFISYIHHKGAHYQDKFNFAQVSDWRRLLEYFNIEKWRDCVSALDKHETTGINFSIKPWEHYSGNFWWARSSYIKKLPLISRPKGDIPKVSQFGQYTKGWAYRFDAEAWIGMKNPTWYSHFTSNVDHYHTGFPPEIYRKD